mgnify:CR=1 FL=1
MSQVPSEFVRRRAATVCPLIVENAIAAVASMALAGILFSLTRALTNTTGGA